MKMYYYIMLLSVLLIAACSKDLGNYNYHKINELQIEGVAKEYLVRTSIDTLRITPTIKATMDEADENRYNYSWIIKYGQLVYDTIGRAKDLVYPVALGVLDHDLFYRVQDKKTGVSWTANAKVKVSTAFSRGLLLMGEDEEGYAEAEMLSMLSDTIHIPQILSRTELPRLHGPVSLVHTGGTGDDARVWAMTGEGAYFLDRATMTASVNNIFSRFVFTSGDIELEDLYPVVTAPQIKTRTGTTGSSLYRAMITAGGDLFGAIPLFMGGDYYNNPVNCLASAPEKRIPAAPYLLYPINNMGSLIWYDQEGQRFLNFTGIGLSTSSTVLTDNIDDIFPWNQPVGRQLIYAENTRNTDGGSVNGNSFSIMRDADNTCFIYKFYANGTNPAKRGAYVVKPLAKDFAKADLYAFSSNRSVVFYAVGSKLYAYDYNPGFEKIYTFPEITDPITMIKFDTQIDPQLNSLYIATYNSVSKGILTRMLVGTDPNVVELLPESNSSWSGLIKIKDVNWRAVN
ncbi:PKD-like family lipoprotein [Sphingobacterium faecale]|uniref:PKD family protein n=1 Tax=Sphingobacterium faecale TaxID=2803775 RepID=A0ABS1QXM3_9SPHI|nr:PKD-like family lipoprotein [Sphingobacterium faecale]MBL1407180.1 hypothetical protein [Sphingobacterium faecale]